MATGGVERGEKLPLYASQHRLVEDMMEGTLQTWSADNEVLAVIDRKLSGQLK